MAQVLKVDEWQSPSGRWYVADVHNWTVWRQYVDILGEETLVDYIDILYNKYNATIFGTIGVKNEEPANVLFSWPAEEYRYAHQFKLDVNRIARKKNYMVERSF